MTGLPAPAVRAAVADDAAAMARLGDQLGYPSTADQMQRRVEAIVGQPGHAVLVAEYDGHLVGWTHVFVQLRLETDPFAEIGGLVVDAAFRSRGIGAQLMEVAERRAAELGATELRVRTNVVRDRAHAFYEREGYELRKSQRVYVKRVG